jgi:hypothetical protein
LRKTLRVVLWAVGAIIALPIVLYLILFAINFRDRPPSAEALAFEATLRDTPVVADADNAYVFLLGYSAPRDRDPAVIGAERAAWIRAMRDDLSVTWDSDPLPKDGAESRQVYEAIRDFFCDPDAHCDAVIENKRDGVKAAVVSEAWALERYRQFVAYRAWAAITTQDFRTPWPEFSPVGQSRMLYLLEAWLRADAGDGDGARDALDADLEFWRRALRDSDILLTKAIAGSYVRRHFQWGNLILRRLPPAARTEAIPASWRRPLSNEERSMARALTYEWDYGRRTMKLMKAPESAATAFGAKYSPTIGDRINSRLSGALLQPQDSANQFADLLLRLEALTDVPYTQLSANLVRARDADKRRTGLAALYNIVGDLSVPDRGDLADYGARVADLEGVRRAALVTVELRARGVPTDDVAAALALDNARNPYTGEALQWVAARWSIGVTGLQSSTNRYTEFLY